MTTFSLWKEKFGTIVTTLKALDAAGVTAHGLKKIRSNPALATQIATLLEDRNRRTRYVYPLEYTGLSPVAQQIKLLQQKVPVFAELDADWALNEGQDWYDSLTLHGAVEGPLVYVWNETLGGYCATHDIILKALAKERQLHNRCEGRLTPERLRQSEATREAELQFKADQPGDFLIVPSQVGKRWGNYSVREVRESYHKSEFGHGVIAGGCLILSHPNRLVRHEELDMDFPGDEFGDPDADDRFDRTLVFRYSDGEVMVGTDCCTLMFTGSRVVFGTNHVDYADDYYGSVSGFLPL